VLIPSGISATGALGEVEAVAGIPDLGIPKRKPAEPPAAREANTHSITEPTVSAFLPTEIAAPMATAMLKK
jgi:hypothetical protein